MGSWLIGWAKAIFAALYDYAFHAASRWATWLWELVPQELADQLQNDYEPVTKVITWLSVCNEWIALDEACSLCFHYMSFRISGAVIRMIWRHIPMLGG